MLIKNAWTYRVARKIFRTKFFHSAICSALYLINLKRKPNHPPFNDVIGLVSVNSSTGLGKVTKLLHQALSESFVTYSYFISIPNKHLKKKISRETGINIYVGNPDLIIRAFAEVLNFHIVKKYNIGLWFWELESIPKSWFFSKVIIDEIWVQSEFNFKAFKRLSDRVVKIPFYIDFKVNDRFTREILDLPSDKFIFIFTFDFLSYYYRKNPEAVIKAFLAAFRGNTNAFLLIKSVNGDCRPVDKAKLMRLIEGELNIQLRDDFIAYDEQVALISLCDCYVSLHRSEGLGMGMAEAMYLGKPVIATNYSGNLEFMNKNNSCLVKFTYVPVSNESYIYAENQFWAEPDLADAVLYMKKIIEDQPFRERIAHQAYFDMRNNFSKENFEKFITHRLAETLTSR